MTAHPEREPESVRTVKARAREMLQTLAEQDLTPIRYVTCLNALAQQAGYRVWPEYRTALIREALAEAGAGDHRG
ncbi:MAG: hypothetical protein Q4C67_11290 [Deinococcus sp.]|nr:hypothetical protein [Deinococcus sp.]